MGHKYPIEKGGFNTYNTAYFNKKWKHGQHFPIDCFLAFVQQCSLWFSDHRNLDIETCNRIGKDIQVWYQKSVPNNMPIEVSFIGTFFRKALHNVIPQEKVIFDLPLPRNDHGDDTPSL